MVFGFLNAVTLHLLQLNLANAVSKYFVRTKMKTSLPIVRGRLNMIAVTLTLNVYSAITIPFGNAALGNQLLAQE